MQCKFPSYRSMTFHAKEGVPRSSWLSNRSGRFQRHLYGKSYEATRQRPKVAICRLFDAELVDPWLDPWPCRMEGPCEQRKSRGCSRRCEKYLLAIRCSDPIRNQNGWKRWYNLVINANCLKTRFPSSFWTWCTARTNLHTKLVLKIVELPVLLKVLPKQSLTRSWILLYMQPLSPVSRYECKGSMASHGHSLPYSICGSPSHNVCSYFTQLISFQIAFKFKTGWCFQPSWKICS